MRPSSAGRARLARAVALAAVGLASVGPVSVGLVAIGLVAIGLVGAGLIAIGCDAPRDAEHARTGSLPAGQTPLDVLSRRHARVRERMEARGYEELPPTARVFVTEDRGVVLPLDLETGACSTIVALASSGLRDLRLTLYDGEGEEAARDEVPGEGGLVHVCPEGSGGLAPFHLAVEARDGTGSVALAQLRSDPGRGEGFEGLFDDVLAPRVPFHDVEATLAETRAAMRARGLSPIDATRVEWLGEGGALRVPVRFEAGQCYVAIARGGAGAHDVDLFLFDPAGVEVGRDLGTDAEPTIQHCVASAEGAPSGGRFIVEARAFEGEGAVGVLVLAAGAELAPDEGAALGTALAPEPREGVVAPDLAIDVLAAELARLGFAPPVFASRDASIAPGEARTHEVVVGPGCALIVASASHAGMDVDLYLADSAGRELDTDTAVNATARVRVCRDEATVLRVAVKAYGRDGRYAVATLRAPAAIEDVQGLRLEEAIAGPRGRGFEPIDRLTIVLADGATDARDIAIEPWTCVAIAVAGGAEVRDVDVFLRDAAGALVASESGPGALGTVSRCAEDEPLALRLETVALPHGGELALAILRGAPSAPPTAPTTPVP